MDDDELMALERAGWDALSGPRGAEFYDEHLDAEALMVFPFGVLDRAGALEAMVAGPPWSRYALADPRVLRLGDDVATLVYHARARREGQPEFSALCASTYVRRGDRWKLALHQQSPS